MLPSALLLFEAYPTAEVPSGRAGLPQARRMLGEARACLGCESRSTASELVRRRSVLLALLPPRLAAGLAWPVTHSLHITGYN